MAPPEVCRARSTDAAYEPGSGSTIMGYAGGNPPMCGSESGAGQSDDYFHAVSLREIKFVYHQRESANG
jgi:hypothetical protein